MQLFIEETYEDMSRRAADLIAAQLIVDPAFCSSVSCFILSFSS